MRPKRIDIWELEHQGVKIQVPVFMSRDQDKPGFLASIYDQTYRNSDIEKLRAEIREAFHKHLMFEWVAMVQVSVHGSIERLVRTEWDRKKRLRGSAEVTLRFYLSRYWIGRDQSGNVVHCHNRGDEERYHTETGLPRVNFYQDSAITALVPDTEENRAALDRVITKLEKVLEQLKHDLSEDNIEGTLAKGEE